MQVHCTRDYNKFQRNEFNRPTCQSHVNRIAQMEGFEKSFPFHPVIVNQDFVIIDGHHRFEAAKLIKAPIYYMVQLGAAEDQIMECNANKKNWDNKNFLDFHIKRENEHYKFIQSMKEEHKIPLHVLNTIICRLGVKGNKSDYNYNFKNGYLEIVNKNQVQEFITETIPIIKQVRHDHGYEVTRHFFTDRFMCALIALYLASKTRYYKIMEGFKTKWTKVPLRSASSEYIKDLQTFVKSGKQIFEDVKVIEGRKKNIIRKVS